VGAVKKEYIKDSLVASAVETTVKPPLGLLDDTTLVEIEDINVGRVVVGTTLEIIGLLLLDIKLGPLDGVTEGEYFEDIKDGKVLVGKADGLIL